MPVGGHAGILDGVPRAVLVLLVALLVLMLTVTGIGFWLSYESLHRWAEGHGLHGQAAWVWPAAVDSFIGIGELGSAVFLWMRRDRLVWWERISWYFAAVTVLGFSGSLAANIAAAGRDGGARFVAALPPAAALIAFAGLIRVGHEMFDRWQASVPVSAEGAPARLPAVPVPSSVVPVERAPVPVATPAPARASLPAGDARVEVPEVAVPPAGQDHAPAPRAPKRVAAARTTGRAPLTVVPADDDGGKRARARDMYAVSLAAGAPLTVAEMVAQTGMSERWVKQQRAAVKAAG